MPASARLATEATVMKQHNARGAAPFTCALPAPRAVRSLADRANQAWPKRSAHQLVALLHGRAVGKPRELTCWTSGLLLDGYRCQPLPFRLATSADDVELRVWR